MLFVSCTVLKDEEIETGQTSSFCRRSKQRAVKDVVSGIQQTTGNDVSILM